MPSILLRSAPSGASELLEFRQTEVVELLQSMLLELKKLNLQAEIVNDEIILEEDVDDYHI